MNQKGFTLSELMVVIAVIMILSGAVFIRINEARHRAKIANGLNFSKQISAKAGIGVMGAWSFDSNEGSIFYDFSGRGNDCDGSLGSVNGSDLVEGVVGQGLDLNTGSDSGEYLRCGVSPDFSSLEPIEAVTIEAWVKTDDQTGNRFIATKWYGYSLESYRSGGVNAPNGRFCVFVERDGSATPNEKTQCIQFNTGHFNNQWHHMVGTYNSDTRKLEVYLDGKKDNERILASGWGSYLIENSTANYLTIGMYASNYFSGVIDEVKGFKVALSETEIRKHYVQGLLSGKYVSD